MVPNSFRHLASRIVVSRDIRIILDKWTTVAFQRSAVCQEPSMYKKRVESRVENHSHSYD
jgi:hypothetical protein